MSYDADSVEKLTALYESQSPAAFIAFSMEGLPQNNEHAERFDKAADDEHGELSHCGYCCCSDKGYCKTWKGHCTCIGLVLVLLICCCYATNGFFGRWPYWPF